MPVHILLGIAVSIIVCLMAYALLRRGSLFVGLCEWITGLVFLGVSAFYLSLERVVWTMLAPVFVVAVCEIGLLVHGIVVWLESKESEAGKRIG